MLSYLCAGPMASLCCLIHELEPDSYSVPFKEMVKDVKRISRKASVTKNVFSKEDRVLYCKMCLAPPKHPTVSWVRSERPATSEQYCRLSKYLKASGGCPACRHLVTSIQFLQVQCLRTQALWRLRKSRLESQKEKEHLKQR